MVQIRPFNYTAIGTIFSGKIDDLGKMVGHEVTNEVGKDSVDYYLKLMFYIVAHNQAYALEDTVDEHGNLCAEGKFSAVGSTTFPARKGVFSLIPFKIQFPRIEETVEKTFYNWYIHTPLKLSMGSISPYSGARSVKVYDSYDKCMPLIKRLSGWVDKEREEFLDYPLPPFEELIDPVEGVLEKLSKTYLELRESRKDREKILTNLNETKIIQ